jgi:regulator of nucleoside diphosphate kinase
MNKIPSGLPPSITLSSRDAERLEALLESPQWQNTPAAQSLLAELARAGIVDDAELPADVVSMQSQVECIDESSGEQHNLTLVYPHEADADAGKISVLAPVGSALLGLSVGQSIDWDGPGGRKLRLRVTAVRHPSA